MQVAYFGMIQAVVKVIITTLYRPSLPFIVIPALAWVILIAIIQAFITF